MKTFFFIVFLRGVVLCSVGFLGVSADTHYNTDNPYNADDPHNTDNPYNADDPYNADNNPYDNCPTEWTRVHRSCYKFFLEQDSLAWDDANGVCKKHGGELISIAGLREKKELEMFLKERDYQGIKWWAGLNKLKKGYRDQWEWLDRNSVNERITPWDNIRKQSRSDRFCGSLLYSSETIQVSNWRCASHLPFICELQLIVPRPRYEITFQPDTIRGATIVDPEELVQAVGEATKLPNYETAKPTSPSQGATIDDPGDFTDKLEGTGDEGNIVGVSKVNGQETSMTGGSMMIVVSKGNSNTPPQEGLNSE